MTYDIHKSSKLVELFNAKPYQGNDPASAKVLILGNDANYSPQISNHKFFDQILDYHADGVGFWQETGCHHPFLLPCYPFDRRKGGVRYHTNFAKLGFGPENAEDFSFIELLNLPTTGNTGDNKELFFEMLDADHLRWIESLMFGSDKKFILVNQTLARSIKRISNEFGLFKELNNILSASSAPSIASDTSSVTIYNGYSFSASISDEYLRATAELMSAFIGQRETTSAARANVSKPDARDEDKTGSPGGEPSHRGIIFVVLLVTIGLWILLN